MAWPDEDRRGRGHHWPTAFVCGTPTGARGVPGVTYAHIYKPDTFLSGEPSSEPGCNKTRAGFTLAPLTPSAVGLCTGPSTAVLTAAPTPGCCPDGIHVRGPWCCCSKDSHAQGLSRGLGVVSLVSPASAYRPLLLLAQ